MITDLTITERARAAIAQPMSAQNRCPLCEARRSRVFDLETALRSIIDMETDRYACASERNRVFDIARKILEK